MSAVFDMGPKMSQERGNAQLGGPDAGVAPGRLRYLLSKQNGQGYWWADLTADTTLESDFILLELWLHPPVDGVWNPPTRALIDKATRFDSGTPAAGRRLQHLRARARRKSAPRQGLHRAEAGGHPRRRSAHAARSAIASWRLGGLQAANSYVKINLSLFGLYPREQVPIDSAGDDAAGQLDLRDVVVDAAPSSFRCRSCRR